MLYYDTLDKMAASAIPEGTHTLLHVDSREAWVNLVSKFIESKKKKLTKLEIKYLLTHWEKMLYQHYSILN